MYTAHFSGHYYMSALGSVPSGELYFPRPMSKGCSSQYSNDL